MGTPTLSSALSRFTSEFGMGSGGSNTLLPPGKLAEKPGSESLTLTPVFPIGDIYRRKALGNVDS